MKKTLNTIIAIVIIAVSAWMATSCNNLANDNVLSYDSTTAIEMVTPDVNAEQWNVVNSDKQVNGNISYTSTANLLAFGGYDCFSEVTATGNNVAYTLDAIKETNKAINGETVKVTLTRDVFIWLKSVNVKYMNYGYFNHPIKVRQYGSYTQYATPKELKSYNDKKDKDDQYYAIGTVVSVSEIETDSYPITKYNVNPQYLYDRGAMPSISDAECPANLSEKFMTVTVTIDGENVKFLVNDLARDNFLETLRGKIKSGDTVEISLMHANYDSDFGGIINVDPFAVFVK